MNKGILITILLLIMSLAAIAWAEEPAKNVSINNEAMEQINLHYQAIKSYKAEYEQISESKALGGAQPIVFKDVSQGEIVFKKPDLIRLDQKEPRVEILVSNDKAGWWYIPDEKKAYKYTSQTQSGGMRALVEIFSGKGKLTDSFSVLPLPSKDLDINLRLQSKLASTDFDYLDIGLDKETLVLKNLVIAYITGQRTTFTFKDIRENVDVPSDLFAFIPPAGTEVNEGQ